MKTNVLWVGELVHREWTQSSSPWENIRTADCSDIRTVWWLQCWSHFTTSTGRGGADALDDVDEKDATNKDDLGFNNMQHMHANTLEFSGLFQTTSCNCNIGVAVNECTTLQCYKLLDHCCHTSVLHKQSTKTTTCDGISLKYSGVGNKRTCVVLLHVSCYWCRMDKKDSRSS